MKFLLRLYPKAWRERYGAEVARMLEDSGAGLRDAPNLVKGALDAHLRPGPLGLPPGRVRGWFTLERSAGLAAIGAGLAWIASHLILIAADWSGSERADAIWFVALAAAAGLSAAFAMAGLMARHMPDRRSRVMAATAVALIGGGCGAMMAVILVNAASPGVSLLPYRSGAFVMAGPFALLLGTLVGVAVMWGRAPVGRRWLAFLAVACLLDLVLFAAERSLTFKEILGTGAGGAIGLLVGAAWIGLGGSVLEARPRRAPGNGSGRELESSRVRFNWPIALAISAAAIVLVLGLQLVAPSERPYGIPLAFQLVASVALWLTPLALAWRVPSAKQTRPLITGLVLVGLNGVALWLIAVMQPIANLSGLYGQISVLLMLASAVGYVLVGRELIHLAPDTPRHRGLFVAICGLSVVPQLVLAAIEMSLFPKHPIGLRHEVVASVVPITVALAQAFALWAPIASALARSEPRRFWRPLALVLPATLIVGLATDVASQNSVTYPSDAVFRAMLVAGSAQLAAGLLWLFALGWHFPGSRTAVEPAAEAAPTA